MKLTIKIHTLAEWIKNHDSTTYWLQETQFRSNGMHRLKMKAWGGNIFYVNNKQKRAGLAIITSDQRDNKFKTQGANSSR